jgi:hypothetical protein
MPSKKKKPIKKKPKKSKIPFKIGAMVTGTDRSYKRSIYKFMAATEDSEYGVFEFQSLGWDVIQRWLDVGANVTQYQMLRRYDEFRLAKRNEIKESKDAKAKYSLRRVLDKLNIYANHY